MRSQQDGFAGKLAGKMMKRKGWQTVCLSRHTYRAGLKKLRSMSGIMTDLQVG